jgi:hypothetical protein
MGKNGVHSFDPLSIVKTFDPKVGRIKEILPEMDVKTKSPVEYLMRLNELKR